MLLTFLENEFHLLKKQGKPISQPMEMDLLRDSVEKLDDINLSFEEREKVLSRVNAKNLMPIKVYLFYLLFNLFI